MELGAVTIGTDGVTVHFQEVFEAEAKAISQVMEVLFGTAADRRKIGKGGIRSKKDLVIWLW